MANAQRSFLETHTLRIDDQTYVQRYTTCGKKNCWCTGATGHPRTGAPGHGPYWYRVIMVKGNKVHRYKGKKLIPDGKE